jgi:SpoVK/Ycf46/Vps4 family AAA+-type ATPase
LTKYFFVGLPILDERKQIFKVFLTRLRPTQLNTFDLSLLAKKSEGFSGAEIEQAIVEGMLMAFNEKREFTTDDVLLGLKQIIPLSQIEPERTKQLQDWAVSGRVRLAT